MRDFISEPIFDGGRIRSNYSLSKAQEEKMLLAYQKTILNALKDVSNSLVTYKETRERRQEQAEQVKSAADAVRLARLRFSCGNTSYLEVLSSDTTFTPRSCFLPRVNNRRRLRWYNSTRH